MKICFLNGLRNGEEFELSGEEFSIGRELNNDIVIETEGVSRYHVKLFKQPDGSWLLEDLESLNGSKVNDRMVKGEKLLKDGDIVTLGDQKFRMEEGKKVKPAEIPIIQPLEEAAKTPVIENVTDDKKTKIPPVKKVVFQPMPTKTAKAPEVVKKSDGPETIIQTVKPKDATEKSKTEPEGKPEITAKELSESAASIFGEQKKTEKTEKKNTEGNGRKHLFNIMFYLVLLLAVVVFVFWFLNSNGEIKKTQAVSVSKSVKIPLLLHYVKTKVTKDNVFRFSLLIENNSAKFTIDDLKSDRHHNELIKEVKPEYIKALKKAIKNTGFMELAPVSKGSAVNNLDETRKMTIAMDKKINTITIQNNSAPTSFEDIEEAINDFTRDYDLSTFIMSRKELQKQAEESFAKAEEYYDNRKAKLSNLLAAEIRYKITIDYLNQFSPKPKIWDRARKRHAEVSAMRKKIFQELLYEFERLKRLNKIREVIDVLNQMKELTREGSKASKKLQTRITKYSEILKARKR